MSGPVSDLVVLVPDRNMESAVRGLLSRNEALGIRPVKFDIFVHVQRDPGCRRDGHDFLRPFVRQYAHALLLFDRDGCGQEERSRQELEQAVWQRLANSGWDDRAGVVVLDPELEVWVWSDSPHVARCLGWEHHEPDLRTWLRDTGHWSKGVPKPADPKGAMESAMRLVRKQRSSSIYQQLSQSVSFQRCCDPAFLKLQSLLSAWFGL